MEIRLLGGVECTRAGEPFHLPRAKQRALLAVLALRANRPVPAATLVELLWPDRAPSNASNSLQALVSQVRKHLPEARIETHAAGYVLRVDPGEVDALRFERLVRRAHVAFEAADPAAAVAHLDEALALWRGPALADADAASEAARLDAQRVVAATARVDAALALDRYDEAIGLVGELVRDHPLDEALHERLIRALYGAGRQAEALEAFRLLRQRLVEELGIEPSDSVRELHRRVLVQDPALSPRRRRVARPDARAPARAGRLVGREWELREAEAVLSTPDARLLTLVGSAGIGKTRLAKGLASRLDSRFEDGSVFVPLASVLEPEHVASAVAGQLDAASADAVVAFLRRRSLLLVLDDFEHLLGSTPLLREIQALCPGVRMIVTSREPLRIPGEAILVVPPLPLPDRVRRPEHHSLRSYGAVDLFCERAAAAAGFTLSATTADAVVDICHRLDGIPIALELAAAQLSRTDLQGLLRELAERPTALADRPLDDENRHRTLRAAIAWSVDRMKPVEQAVLEELSVFSGRISADAAAAVSGRPDIELTMDALAAANLVQPTAEGYELLATIRDHARSRLESRADASELERRHAIYYLELAERQSGAGDEGLQVLEREHDNLELALRRLAASGDDVAVIRLGVALWRFWFLRGRYRDRVELLRASLARAADAPAALRADGATAAGVIAYLSTDYAAAAVLLEEALALEREVGDDRGVGRALRALAATARECGRYAEAIQLQEESLSVWRRLGDIREEAAAMQGLGFTSLLAADLVGARPRLEQAVSLNVQADDLFGRASSLNDLALVAVLEARLDEAEELAHVALASSREIGFKEGVAWALYVLGRTALARDEPDDAVDLLEASLELHRELGDRWSAARTLDALAAARLSDGDVAAAATAFDGAEHMRSAIAVPIPAVDRPLRAGTAAALERGG